jgi:hypothetical protein
MRDRYINTHGTEMSKRDSPVLVKLERCDNNIARVDSNGGACTIHLVTLYSVNVDDPFLAVHLRDLAIPPSMLAPHNAHLIILANRD